MITAEADSWELRPARQDDGHRFATTDQGIQSEVSGHGVPQLAASGTAMRASAREPARSPQAVVPRDRLRLRGWGGLLAGLALIWLLMGVILPWGQQQPGLKPIMDAIIAADVDAGTYWYSQSEKTAVAQNYIRNALNHPSRHQAVNDK